MTTITDTSWEQLCDMARGLLDEQDKHRWELGEIADTVETHYKQSSILKFCEQVKAKPKTIYQYAAVYRFYPRDCWKQYPLARYTQWRDTYYALKDKPNAQQTALSLIARTNDKDLTMKDFYKELRAAAGKSTPETNLIYGEMTVDDAINALMDYDAGKVIRIVVKELDQ